MKNSKRMKTAVITLITAGLCVLFSGCPGAGAETGDETGSVTGRAFFTGGDSNAGIIVAIEKVEDGRAVSLVRQKAGRAVTSQGTKTTTDADGNYTFEKVAPGNYTVYAASRDSKEKAVALDVAVAAGKIATVEGLELTPVGHVSGTVTVDDTGSLGTLVFIAGTSYAAWTDEEGAFTISDVPAKTGYSIVVSRDGVSGVWKSADVVKGETTDIGTKNIVTDDPGSLRGLRIIYDGNHYDYGTLPVDTTSYQAGDTVSVPDPEDPDDPNSDQDLFGREGWAFAGWNTKPDGTGTAYFPASWQLTTGYDSDWNPIRGDLLQRDTVTFEDRDITLYAIWAIGW
ncbi:MAG: hypothetical protein LBH57_01760, partial [Treponema sp.]|nr:hypothetical protein [Treponema sp.]